MTPLERFRELEKQAGPNNTYPVVTCRYGYASFVAYIFKVENGGSPSEWWVGELDKEQRIVDVKRICCY